ncbi:MAG TPA: zf-HC2 domain-containing protein [Pyrinomonadaceae bacterium]|nr:zf-HC2 domain-containing protein [Pyrinomonadaceae bacterium]
MTKKCLDEGIIQAYLDGELPAASASAAAAHISACDACAAALGDAEQDSAFFAAAFAPDANVPVPTEVLRARVNAAVARLEAEPGTDARRARGWSLNALLAPLSGLLSFTPQRAAAFAGVLAVVAFAVVFLAVRRQTTPPAAPGAGELAQQNSPVPEAPAAPEITSPDEKVFEDVVNRADAPKRKAATPAAHRKPRPAGAGAATPRPAPEAARAVEPVPGEKNYREAIASLEVAVKAGGDAVLNPSARIEYERTIAVLDRAIEETRRVALRNPKDKDAVSFLMAAYQSKVELMTTVADQTQVAALGR